MILVNLALAAEPVTAVDCARPVHFATPYRWSWAADLPAITEATALVIRADPELVRPRDVGGAVLYVAGWPAEVLWWSGDTAVVLAPLALHTAVQAWFGSTTLPERVDASHRKAETVDASRIASMPVKAWAADLAWTGSRRALVDTLRAWADACR